jgi:uncharacterized phage protein gp47/JayE
MVDILDADGLTVKTAAEIRSDLVTGFQVIYGSDINVDQNSPDGQLIGILTQMCVDIRELAVMINNGFDPDYAVGRILDERVVINNIERAGGTFTIVPVTITVDRTVTLQGLDADFNDINGTGYTVQDNAGTEFILVDTNTITAGAHVLNFRAKDIGLVETTIGTITTAVTIVLGVTAINNASAALEIGQDEETDAQLRVRRQQSVAIASTGYLNGLLGDVLALDGVTDAKLYENYTDTIDADGIPAHGTWLIVEGGANADIGEIYYENKSYGSNMKGAVSVNIITASGGLFTALFDRPTASDLYIRFDIQRTVPLFVFDTTEIKSHMVDNLIYRIGDFAETSGVTAAAVAAITAQGGGGVPINVEISDDGLAWVDFLDVAALDDKWTLDSTRIAITVL